MNSADLANTADTAWTAKTFYVRNTYNLGTYFIPLTLNVTAAKCFKLPRGQVLNFPIFF